MSRRIVTVFGSGKIPDGGEEYRFAYELGACLARAGFAVANGGYGGTMLACSKGAAENGGKVTGVTCDAFGRGGANEYVGEEIRTPDLRDRLGKLVELGEAYVVLPGGTGTLLELAWVWESANKGFDCQGKKIIITGAFWDPLVEMMASVKAKSEKCLLKAESPEEVVKLLSE